MDLAIRITAFVILCSILIADIVVIVRNAMRLRRERRKLDEAEQWFFGRPLPLIDYPCDDKKGGIAPDD